MNISEVLSIIGSLVAIGMLLDNVFLNEEKRKELVEASLFGSKEGSEPASLAGFLQSCHKYVFNDFFGYTPVSAQYISRVAIISVISLCIAFVYKSEGEVFQAIEFYSERSTFEFTAIFLVINIFVDWVLIYQTQILLRFASLAKNLFEMMFALIADVLLSIKVYVVLFSFLAFLVIYLASIYIQSNDDLWNNHRVNFLVNKNRYDEEYFEYKVTIYNGEDLEDTDTAFSILSKETYLDPRMFLPYEYFGELVEVNIQKNTGDAGLGENITKNEIAVNDNFSYKVLTVVNLYDVRLLVFDEFYEEISDLETNVIKTINSKFSAREVYGLARLGYGFYPVTKDRRYCANQFVVFNYYEDYLSEDKWESCDNKIIGVGGFFNAVPSHFYHWDTPIWSQHLPVATLFTSSLLTTLLIYFFVFAFIGYRGAAVAGAGVKKIILPLAIRAPFGIIGLISGGMICILMTV
ncbi:MAG: hypothetical protein Tsb002_13200 [Wenzhouxiangellaceae bacterium]